MRYLFYSILFGINDHLMLLGSYNFLARSCGAVLLWYLAGCEIDTGLKSLVKFFIITLRFSWLVDLTPLPVFSTPPDDDSN